MPRPKQHLFSQVADAFSGWIFNDARGDDLQVNGKREGRRERGLLIEGGRDSPNKTKIKPNCQKKVTIFVDCEQKYRLVECRP